MVRLDVRNTGGVRIALGLGGQRGGGQLPGRVLRLEPGVWLPRLLQGSARGKKLVFFGFHVRERLSFANYRRFDVSVDEKLQP